MVQSVKLVFSILGLISKMKIFFKMNVSLDGCTTC